MISNEKEILLNIMYTGKYLTDGNIGHEVINLFKDDKKQNYIYVLPVGTIGEIHDDKVEVILLVKRCNACLLEILAKAEGLKKIGTKKDEQKQYIENEDIRYGHVLLPEIFEGNVENGNYVTFRAENVIKAAQPIFITTDEILSKAKGYYFVGDIKFPRRQKGYVSDKKHAETYKILQGIIKEKTNWGEETKTLEDYEDFLQNKRNGAEHDFISIIKKDYDELVFSNLFQYIFSSRPEGFNLFVKEVLQADIKFSDNFVVEREKENMDLFITDGNSIIVIENKIKSQINGIRKNDNDKTSYSQLSKYYDYVEQQYPCEQKKYFLFAPDYNMIDLSVYNPDNKYTLIPYSKIYDFFAQYRECYKNVKYFDEFLSALSKHKSNTDNRNEEEMFTRFSRTIQNKNK